MEQITVQKTHLILAMRAFFNGIVQTLERSSYSYLYIGNGASGQVYS